LVDLIVVLFVERFVKKIELQNRKKCHKNLVPKGDDNAHAVARMIIAGPVLDFLERDSGAKINLPIVSCVAVCRAIAVARS
jgi:hypothetical protein